MGRGFRQGRYELRNPDKYTGDPSNIVYRSSWELSFCQFLDNNPNILEWSSEEIAIPYIKPTTGRVHKYYPDYWVKFRNKAGKLVQEIIEVKPSTQTRQPRRVGKRKKQQLYENLTYAVNVAKWQAATQFCDKYGMKFRLLTEKELFK